jgi:hypothetical protein
MNIVGFHIFIFVALVACWSLISGRAAERGWRDWGQSEWRVLFLGWYFDDLRSLKRYYFWFGWLILAVLVFIYAGFWYGYITGR